MRFGYKGAALAGMAEVLSSVVTGMPHCSRLLGMAGPDFSTPRHLGHFFIVIQPTRFVPEQIYDAAMHSYLLDLRNQPSRPGTHVMAPGDREWAVEAERLVKGIPIHSALETAFAQLADQLHIPRLENR
jgi:ureidoglycolate dehydrogenase (NAD+)